MIDKQITFSFFPFLFLIQMVQFSSSYIFNQFIQDYISWIVTLIIIKVIKILRLTNGTLNETLHPSLLSVVHWIIVNFNKR